MAPTPASVKASTPATVPASAASASTGAKPFRWGWLYRSPIGKKLLTGITGLILAGFVVVHLLGNLLLLRSAAAFNRYGDGLERLKPLVWSVEAVLLGAIALHALIGIQIYLSKKNARPIAYESYKSVNQGISQTSSGPIHHSPSPASFQTLSSRTMIWTGLTLAAFIIWHLATFKFGPHYEVSLAGRPVRDLARLVVETFQQPAYTFSYVGLVGLLGFHLRHGLWSALQSLGMLGRGTRRLAFGLAGLGAGAIATGYLVVPLAIYFGWIS